MIASGSIHRRIQEAYEDRILGADILDEAVDLYLRSRQFGVSEAAEVYVQGRSLDALNDLLDQPRTGDVWLKEVEQALARLDQVSSSMTLVAQQHLQYADVLEAQVLESLRVERFPVAREQLDVLKSLRFDALVLDHLARSVVGAEKIQARARVSERRTEAVEFAAGQMVSVLEQSCLDFDVSLVVAARNRLARGEADLAANVKKALNEQIHQRLSRCVQQLVEIDSDRAVSLIEQARKEIPELSALQTINLDPCGAGYLVGNGAQAGRGGYCVDKLSNGGSGPRLVVVPSGEGRFAISKHEISWLEISDVLPGGS